MLLEPTPRRVVEDVRDAARVVEQLANGDAPVEAPQLGEAAAKRVVELQASLLNELQDRGGHERLGDGSDHERVVGRQGRGRVPGPSGHATPQQIAVPDRREGNPVCAGGRARGIQCRGIGDGIPTDGSHGPNRIRRIERMNLGRRQLRADEVDRRRSASRRLSGIEGRQGQVRGEKDEQRQQNAGERRPQPGEPHSAPPLALVNSSGLLHRNPRASQIMAHRRSRLNRNRLACRHAFC